MYRIAICDDDLVFGSLLEQYLQNFAKTRRIPIDVLVFARGEEYLEFLIEEFPVDLIFLDIQFEKQPEREDVCCFYKNRNKF